MTQASRPRYDFFVSYRRSEPDWSWVRSRLVPALTARGHSVCVDDLTFALGAPLVLEMGRAVESSRFTLAVLTPAYLDGNFAQLEAVLAEHLGLEEGATRLIVIMREPATPWLSMRARLWLDLTDDATFDAGIDRLSQQLAGSAGDERPA